MSDTPDLPRPHDPLPYDDIQEGDFLIPDGGFFCLTEGNEYEVMADDHGAGLYILCHPEGKDATHHRHYLIGQIEVGPTGKLFLTGFTKKLVIGA